jgi:predicted transposase YbfD/YdcC
VFSSIDPSEFGGCFVEWAKALRHHTAGEVIAIDGKTICNSHQGETPAIHVVSAYATQSGLYFGQVATGAKSNEITAIPELFGLLYLQECTVTIDAMGCQRDIAKKIKDSGAEYILAVKGNQQTLEEGILDTVRFYKPISCHEDTDCGHGRIETRRCSVFNNLDMIEGTENGKGRKRLSWSRLKEQWSGKVMSMIGRDISGQASIKRKRAKALQNESYRESLLNF